MALNVSYDKKPYVLWKTDLPCGKEKTRSKFFTLYDRNWWLVLEKKWTEDGKDEIWHLFLKQISPVKKEIQFRVTVYLVDANKNLKQLKDSSLTFSRLSLAVLLGFDTSLVRGQCGEEGGVKKELTFLFTFEVPLKSLDQLQAETDVERRSLELLSRDIEKLYNHRDHSDLVLKCNGVTFEAHRNILSARSNLFESMLRDSEPGDKLPPIVDMGPAVLDIFLQYLYCGKLSTAALTDDEALDLYQVAAEHGILHLKDECTSFLITNLKEGSICRVFFVSMIYKDSFLMDSAVSFLMDKNEFFESDTWKDFINAEPGLSVTVQEKYKKYKETGLF